MSENLAVAGGAFVASLVATPLAGRFATHIGLLDRPGPLKPQARLTPYLGGAGLVVGIGIGAAVADPWLLLPLGMALVLGTADDVRPVPPAFRLVGELAIGLVLAAIVSTRFGAVGFLLVPLATLLLVNAFNLLDGLDALCASVTLVGAAGFSLLLTGHARTFALALAAAAAAFLVFNRPPAKVYLGDGGAYLVGISMTVLLAWSWGTAVPRATGVGALTLIALPVTEVALAIFRRVRSGHSLFAGDRDHPYDALMRSGWRVGSTVVAYAVAELLAVALALLASHLASGLAWAVLALTALGLAVGGLKAGSQAPNQKPTGELST